MSNPPPQTTWVLTDGSIGMDNQGLAVAEAVGLPVTLKHAKRTGFWRFLPTPLQLAVPPRWLLQALTPESGKLAPPWPRLLISIGRHSVPLALAIRRLSGGATFALHIQNPTVPPRLFDLVAAPAHDGMDARDALRTLGAAHRVTPARLAAEAELYRAQVEALPRPRVAVLLGGDSRAFRFDAETGKKLGQDLKALVAKGGSLLITPSRRTPTDAGAALKIALGDVPHLFWSGEGPNPYFGFLALANVIVATADSVNMVTEAAGTGKPVYVYPLPGRGSRRIATFHLAMQAHGATRPYDGTLDTWSYPPVNDTERIAAIVRERLGLGAVQAS